MTKTSEFRAKPSEPSSSAAAKAVILPASHTEVPLNRGGFSVTTALELDPNSAWGARCLWCHRTFKPRSTGGSAQKFCCAGHRQQFGDWLHRHARRSVLAAAKGWSRVVLDRGASLDDEGDRCGSTFGGLLEGLPHERARCL